MSRLLLLGGIATPVMGIILLAVVKYLTPSHNMISDFPSLFGMRGAAYSSVFNNSLLTIALLCLFSAIALTNGLIKKGSNAFLSSFTGLSMTLVAVYLAMVALFPIPSPLHSGFHLGIAGSALPIIGLTALRSAGNSRYHQITLIILSFYTSLTCIFCKLQNLYNIPDYYNGLQVLTLTLSYFLTVSILCLAVISGTVQR